MSKNPTTNGNAQMQVAVLSERGKREENQDFMSRSRIPWGEFYIVADGMGGYKGGALAAKMTVEGLESYLRDQSAERPFEQVLQEAVSKANEEVYRKAQSGNEETNHMGSTLAVALISGNQLQVGHVGDSRIYLVHRGKLKLLTTDHTSVQRMVDSGMITEEQARVHPEAHILSRAIGSKPEVEIEIGKPIPLESGDAILLCSDGLSGYVKDQQIEKVVSGTSDVQRIPKQLVNLALESGGDDNITVQFVQYGKPSGKRDRHTLIQAGKGPGRSRWLAAGFIVLAGFIGVFGVSRLMEQRSTTTSTARVDPPKLPQPPPVKPAPPTDTALQQDHQANEKKKAAKGGAHSDAPPQPIRDSKPPQQAPGGKAGATTVAPVASTAPGPTATPSPTPAQPQQANSNNSASVSEGTAPILIFLRDTSEEDLANQIVQSSGSLPAKPSILTPNSSTDIDNPDKLTDCFVFYPDSSLEKFAYNVAEDLNKLQAGKDYCNSEHQWLVGLYKARQRLKASVPSQLQGKHLLIAFPKKKP